MLSFRIIDREEVMELTKLIFLLMRSKTVLLKVGDTTFHLVAKHLNFINIVIVYQCRLDHIRYLVEPINFHVRLYKSVHSSLCYLSLVRPWNLSEPIINHIICQDCLINLEFLIF